MYTCLYIYVYTYITGRAHRPARGHGGGARRRRPERPGGGQHQAAAAEARGI